MSLVVSGSSFKIIMYYFISDKMHGLAIQVNGQGYGMPRQYGTGLIISYLFKSVQILCFAYFDRQYQVNKLVRYKRQQFFYTDNIKPCGHCILNIVLPVFC
jgi:hypothetical protein